MTVYKNGYGWWNGNHAEKNGTNDGFVALFRNKYPSSNFLNLAISGSTIADVINYQSIKNQVDLVSADTTHCFIMSGINDVTVSIRNNKNVVGYPNDFIGNKWYINNKFDTTCNSFESNIQKLLNKNSNMKIYLMIEPTIDNSNRYLYNMCFSYLKFICNKYGINVIDFRQMFKKFYAPNENSFFFDKVHPNKKGYEYMFNYLENHIKYDINDNFTEYPECLITDNEIDFSNYEKAYNTAKNLGLLTNIVSLWQQSFKTIVIDTKTWGGDGHVASLEYTFNYTYSVLNVKNIQYNGKNPFNFNIYSYTTKYSRNNESDEITNVVIPTQENNYFDGQFAEDYNYTNINEINKIGIHIIPYNKVSAITNLHIDLRNDRDGYLICEVVSLYSGFLVQKWKKLFSNDIYYSTMNLNSDSVTWSKSTLSPL